MKAWIPHVIASGIASVLQPREEFETIQGKVDRNDVDEVELKQYQKH